MEIRTIAETVLADMENKSPKVGNKEEMVPDPKGDFGELVKQLCYSASATEGGPAKGIEALLQHGIDLEYLVTQAAEYRKRDYKEILRIHWQKRQFIQVVDKWKPWKAELRRLLGELEYKWDTWITEPDVDVNVPRKELYLKIRKSAYQTSAQACLLALRPKIADRSKLIPALQYCAYKLGKGWDMELKLPEDRIFVKEHGFTELWRERPQGQVFLERAFYPA